MLSSDCKAELVKMTSNSDKEHYWVAIEFETKFAPRLLDSISYKLAN